jgi:hypothetical protein
MSAKVVTSNSRFGAEMPEDRSLRHSSSLRDGCCGRTVKPALGKQLSCRSHNPFPGFLATRHQYSPPLRECSLITILSFW